MKSYFWHILFLLLSLLAYFTNLSSLPFVNSLSNAVKFFIYPIYELKSFVYERARESINTYVYLVHVSKENQVMRRELERYKLYKAELEACQYNLLQISRLMDLSGEFEKYNMAYTRIIAYDPSGLDTFILVDKGQEAGITDGMLALYDNMLVGIVEKAYVGSSRIRTVYSNDFSISASAGGKAYIYKGGFPEGYLLHVKVEDNIKKGEEVYLRLPDKNLPMLLIGVVDMVSSDSKGFFKKVSVKPLADIRSLSFCLILKEKP